MKTTFITATILAALASVRATPLVTRSDPSVTDVLQFALTLEHLEATFYHQALAKMDNEEFEKAGFESWVRGRFAQIGMHEKTHVDFLTAALGSSAVAACKYKFPYTDPKSFAILSVMLEGVGTSAYLGAAHLLDSAPSVLTAAGAILTTEARHASWVGSTALHGAPWSGSLDTPLSANLVYTLASSFIVPGSCPSTNAVLPFTAFPGLTVKGDTVPGKTVTLSYNSTGGTEYLAIMSGLTTEFAPITNKQVTLPQGLQGVAYGVVSTNGTGVSDASTVAGPAILYFPFPAAASNP